MTFPASVDTVTLTVGPLYDAGGALRRGVPLTVTLGRLVLIDEGGAALPTLTTASTNESGVASVVVVATDSAGIDTTGWTYRVRCDGVLTAGGIDVALPAAAPTVAIETLVAQTAADGSTVWTPGAVYSVAGRTGAVTLTAADLTDSTTAGRALVTAADADAQLTALGATAAGAAVLTAADAAAQRTAIGMTAAGSAVATAADADAQLTALGAQPAADLDTDVTALDANAASALRVQQDARLSSTFATLSTAQSITGVKTLTAPLMVPVTSGATYGADLTPAGGLGDAGWTKSGGASWSSPNLTIPSGGSVSCTVAGIVSGRTYQIEVTRSASSGGDMAYSLGAVSASVPSWSMSKVTLVAGASGSLTLTVGTGTWVATVQAISCREVTATATPGLTGSSEVEVRASTTATNLTAIGKSAGRSVTTATNMTAVGTNAGYSATSAANLTAVGTNAGYSATTTTNLTAVGREAGYSATTAASLTAVGVGAGRGATTAVSMTAVGVDAGYSATTAANLTAVGVSAGYSATTATNLTAVGVSAGRSVTTAINLTAVGMSAGYTDGTTATGAALGYVTVLGANAQATRANVAVIGSALSAERQTLCLGNYSALGSDGRGDIALADAQTVPTVNPTGGGLLYSQAGALKWRGSSGTVTTIAPA